MGAVWPTPRFIQGKDGVVDVLTGLPGIPRQDWASQVLPGRRHLAAAARYAEETGLPWRMPTINELESLIDAASHSPALMKDHPFVDIESAYWSSTTSGFEPDWAYVLYLVKGAVGVGYKKNSDFALWPVMPATESVCAENSWRG